MTRIPGFELDSPLYVPCSPGALASVARRATNSR
jgi:hypothetical protein